MFSSLATPSDLPTSTCSLPLSRSLIKKSPSKLSEISRTSDKDSFKSTNNNINARAATLSKYISLQRLDSVGGVESEQSRFSYPPSKGESDSYLMGNILHSSWLQKGLTTPDSYRSEVLPGNKTNSQSFLGTSIAQVSHYLVSSFHQLTEKVSTGVIQQKSLPNHSPGLVKRETNFSMNNSQNLGEPNAHLKLVKFPDDVKRISSYTVTCIKTSIAAPKIKKTGTLQSDSVNVGDGEATVTIPVYESVTNCSSYNMQEQETVSQKRLQCDATQNFMKAQSEKCASLSLCTSRSTEMDQCKTMSCLSDDDDDYESVACSDDCCSEVNSTFLASTDGFSDHTATTDDEWSDSECNFVDDTDSENGFCTWDRFTSNRTPWTCGLYRKQDYSSKLCQQSCVTSSQSFSDGSDIEFKEKNVQLPEHRKKHDAQFHSVNESELTDVMSRPTCLNSNISFILGWPDNNGYDSDDEDSLFSCSDSENCRFEDDDNTTSFSNGSSSCQLWDYFANRNNPLSSAISDICPSSLKKDRNTRRSRTSSAKEGKSNSEEILYKAPSKVCYNHVIQSVKVFSLRPLEINYCFR